MYKALNYIYNLLMKRLCIQYVVVQKSVKTYECQDYKQCYDKIQMQNEQNIKVPCIDR